MGQWKASEEALEYNLEREFSKKDFFYLNRPQSVEKSRFARIVENK
jgi:hypothetical protein